MPKSKEFSVSGSGPTVHLESLDEGVIAVLTLDDSKGTNVMSPEMGDVFSGHIAFIQKDAAVKAVIIRGAGKDFSIGGHRDMLIGLGRAGRRVKELHDFMLAFYNRWLPDFDLTVPVGPGSQGDCIGVAPVASSSRSPRASDSRASGRLHRCSTGLCLCCGYCVRGRNAQVAGHVCGARSLSRYGAANSACAEGRALSSIVADKGQGNNHR